MIVSFAPYQWGSIFSSLFVQRARVCHRYGRDHLRYFTPPLSCYTTLSWLMVTPGADLVSFTSLFSRCIFGHRRISNQSTLSPPTYIEYPSKTSTNTQPAGIMSLKISQERPVPLQYHDFYKLLMSWNPSNVRPQCIRISNIKSQLIFFF